MIRLPNDFVDQIASSTNALLGQLSPMAELVIGVLLAALVIGLLIKLFVH